MLSFRYRSTFYIIIYDVGTSNIRDLILSYLYWKNQFDKNINELPPKILLAFVILWVVSDTKRNIP